MISSLKILARRLGALVIVYGFLRLLFLIFNGHQYGKFTSLEIFQTFVYGLRFDLAAIFLLNFPLILFHLVAPHIIAAKWFDRIGHGLLFVLNIPLLLANLSDLEYYKFTGSRITSDIFLVKKEVGTQIGQLALNFWYVGLILMIIALVLHHYGKNWKINLKSGSIGFFKSLALGFAMVAVSVVTVRGGLQKKVLQPTHAYVLGHAELGTLTLNSTFTLLKSDLTPELAPVEYFSSKEEVVRHIPQPLHQDAVSAPKDNVVVIILESFATEFWGIANEYPGYTPYLDELAKKGLFFQNNFANGRRSIEALPAVLFGVPSLMATPIAKSNYQQNQWKGLGQVLNSAGFHTSFFHGAKKGTMYFDAISAQAGLSDYYPLERYPETKDFDGNWGVYDEPFLLFMVENLSQHKQPFFSLVFTISTHQPYQVPPQYKGQFPSGPLKIHESVGYVDYAVKKFFEAAEKEPWFKDTLFIITGDHTQMSDSEFYNTALGGFMVPLLLYHPSKTWPELNTQKITHHADIMPTVLDYLDIPQPQPLLFGRSVFDNNPGEAMLHLNGNYWLVQNDHFLQFTPDNNEALLFNYQDHEQRKPLENSDLQNRMLKKAKAYIQYYRNGLINNDLYKWNEAYR